MAVRIFTLAKELNMSSKDLIAFLRTQGHPVVSHMSNLDDTVAQILKDRMRSKLPKEKPKPPERAPPPKGKVPAGNGGVTAAGERAGGFQGRPASPAAGPPASKFGPDAPRGGRVAAAGAKPASVPGRPGPLTEAEKKAKEKETPTRKRFFPTREDIYDAGPRFGGGRRRLITRPKQRKDGGPEGSVLTTERAQKIEISLPITVKDLSSSMGIKAAAIMKSLMQHGHPVMHMNQFLDEDMVTTIALELNTDVSFKQKIADVEEAVRKIEEYASKPEDLRPRAPVVTFLGHVDHGKTSLLDKIRQTSVTLKEAGGITQHLGAYRVDKGNVHVVFIDTPGHQAFTEMRARGANVTDVAVLVVAADDGVMPQTEEALSHARAAKVPIVVALNKIDKPNADVMRAKQQLASLGLQPIDWGGDTECVEVSAVTSQGIDNLLETLSLTSEILDLKANPSRPAVGVVLEAEASTSRGVVATVLIREGTLRSGDYVLCGPAHGRIKGAWLNGTVPVKEAGPSTPVKVTGLSMVPEVGDKLYVFEDIQAARDIADSRDRKRREMDRAERQQVTQENIFSRLDSIAVEEVRLIIKADVKGSIEALRSELEGQSTSEVRVKILLAGVGTISQADIDLASASNGIVVGFNVSADERARALADERGIQIRIYQVIYKVTEDVRALLEGRLAPQRHEEVRGHAEIRQIYKASKVGNIAGCIVSDGVVGRNDQIRLLRNGRVVHTGTLSSLKRFKDDAREVRESFECGIKISNYDDIKVGDIIEAFTIVERARQL